MLLTVPPSPSTAGETLNSLQFAARARNISLGPTTAKVNYRNEKIVTKKLQDQLRKYPNSTTTIKRYSGIGGALCSRGSALCARLEESTSSNGLTPMLDAKGGACVQA